MLRHAETCNLDWLGQSSLIYGRNFWSISLSWDVLGCVSSSLRSGLFSLQCGHGTALHSQCWRGTWRSLPRECVADPRNKVKICQDRQSYDVFFFVWARLPLSEPKNQPSRTVKWTNLDTSHKAQTRGFRESPQHPSAQTMQKQHHTRFPQHTSPQGTLAVPRSLAGNGAILWVNVAVSESLSTTTTNFFVKPDASQNTSDQHCQQHHDHRWPFLVKVDACWHTSTARNSNDEVKLAGFQFIHPTDPVESVDLYLGQRRWNLLNTFAAWTQNGP